MAKLTNPTIGQQAAEVAYNAYRQSRLGLNLEKAWEDLSYDEMACWVIVVIHIRRFETEHQSEFDTQDARVLELAGAIIADNRKLRGK